MKKSKRWTLITDAAELTAFASVITALIFGRLDLAAALGAGLALGGIACMAEHQHCKHSILELSDWRE